MIEGNFRWFSSSDSVKKDDLSGYQPQLDLKSRIFKLRFPKRSATDALDRWVQEGGKVSVSELRNITTELKRAQRYKHALEVYIQIYVFLLYFYVRRKCSGYLV